MTKQQQLDILAAIRQDNPARFDELVGKHKNLCFGRFSLLSICYMYRSRRIIKAYQSAMRQEPLVRGEEIAEVYNDFVPMAGRAIRLWAGYNRHDVHPLEMLAIMGDWGTLRRQYGTYALGNEEKTRLLTAIRLRYQVEAEIKDGRLVLPPRPLKESTRRLLLSAAATLTVIVLAAVAVLALGVYYRAGTPIGTAKALSAAKSQHQYILTKDIDVVEADWQDFVLDGAGHTLTFTVGEQPAMQSFAGTIRNCRVVLRLTDLSIRESYACLCLDNLGTWQNVQFVFEREEAQQFTLADFSKQEGEAAQTCVFGGLFAENHGTVTDCSVAGELRWVGQAQVDGEIGVVAGINEGTISGCTIADGIVCDTLDVGGVAFRNELTGVIRNCTLEAQSTVQQITSVYQWSPMVGGIVAQNYGTLVGNSVHGQVICAKQDVVYPEGNITATYIHVGGVAAHNYGIIEHNLVTGIVNGVGDYTVAYVGGITADNYRDTPTQENADTHNVAMDGTLNANIVTAALYGHGYYLYMGGIAGASSGRMTANCFNCSSEKFPSWSNATYQCTLGSLIGYGNFAEADALLADNHVLQLQYNSFFSVTLIPVIGFYEQAGGPVANMSGVTAHDATDFATLEAYWYEEQQEQAD